MKNKIITNLTLKQYENKYKNYKKHLLTFTKQEVEALDKEVGTIGANFVLKNRRWALIDNTYYQLPKPYRKMWFRGLTAAGKMWACIIPIGVVGALGGAGYGVYALINKGGISIEGVDAKYVKVAKAEYDENGNYVISFNMSSEKKIKSITSCRIGDTSLTNVGEFNPECNTEFSFIDHKVIISKKTMNENKGKITIEPVICGNNEYEYCICIDGTWGETIKVDTNEDLKIKVNDIGEINTKKVKIGFSELIENTDYTCSESDNKGYSYVFTIKKEALAAHCDCIFIAITTN